MSNAADIALSAIRSLDRANDVIANNIANVNTRNFQKSRAATAQAAAGRVTLIVEQLNLPIDTVSMGRASQKMPERSNVQLDEELIDLAINKRSYEANIQALKTTEEMQGTLFDLLG